MDGSVRHSYSGAGISVLFLFAFIGAQTDSDTQAYQLMPRETYSLDLPKISVHIDNETKDFDGVRIIFPGSKDQVFIGIFDDMYIKTTSHGLDKTLHKEVPEKSGFLTEFEIKTILKVNKGFLAELENLDKHIQKGKWGRCCYLDAYFAHFLSSYYHLLYAARNSPTALPRAARIPDGVFDVSLSSPKTDARISQWRFSPEYNIKLRIAGKELAYQMKEWQKMLSHASDDVETVSSKDFEESFTIFIRVYFNLKPPSPVIMKKSR